MKLKYTSVVKFLLNVVKCSKIKYSKIKKMKRNKIFEIVKYTSVVKFLLNVAKVLKS